MNNLNTKNSFTLIELVVAVFVFIILLTMALGIYFTIFTKHRAVTESQPVRSDINQVMEVISRDLEEGRVRGIKDEKEIDGEKKYTTLLINLPSKNPCPSSNSPSDCHDECESNFGNCLAYHFDNEGGEIQVKSNADPDCNTGNSDCPPITSGEVIVKDFSFNLDSSIALNSDKQPVTTLSITAKSKEEKLGMSEFTLQNTVVQDDICDGCNEYVGTMKTSDLEISESYDDAYAYADESGTIIMEGSRNYLWTGHYYDSFNDVRYYIDSGIVFDNIDIPSSASIIKANIKFTSKEGDSGTTVKTEIAAQNADNPGTFSDYTDFDNRRNNLTAANVDWNISSGWTAGETYTSPDISSVVEEVMNQTYWDAGESMAFFWLDNSSDENAFRRPYSYDGNTDLSPILHIEYQP